MLAGTSMKALYSMPMVSSGTIGSESPNVSSISETITWGESSPSLLLSKCGDTKEKKTIAIRAVRKNSLRCSIDVVVCGFIGLYLSHRIR